MGPILCMRSVIDRNVVMRRVPAWRKADDGSVEFWWTAARLVYGVIWIWGGVVSPFSYLSRNYSLSPLVP